jgi:surfactin synthase thioesterase subunit
LLVTRQITEDQLTLPGHLFLSGKAAPAKQRKVMKHLLPWEAFFEMLINMGGIPK